MKITTPEHCLAFNCDAEGNLVLGKTIDSDDSLRIFLSLKFFIHILAVDPPTAQIRLQSANHRSLARARNLQAAPLLWSNRVHSETISQNQSSFSF